MVKGPIDQPLPDAEVTWFTDGSSYLVEGKGKVGAAIVDRCKVVWAEPLPLGMSAKKAELIALTKALDLGAGKKINIYKDIRYAFATAHVHGATYQEKGLLTSEGKEIKNKQEILDLLDALMKPATVSIIHCPGHQKRRDSVAQGNNQADQKWLCRSLSWLWACKKHLLGNGTGLRDGLT